MSARYKTLARVSVLNQTDIAKVLRRRFSSSNYRWYVVGNRSSINLYVVVGVVVVVAGGGSSVVADRVRAKGMADRSQKLHATVSTVIVARHACLYSRIIHQIRTFFATTNKHAAAYTFHLRLAVCSGSL